METRMGRGQTSEEWADGAERPGNWQSEMVLDEGDGHARALLQSTDTAGGRGFSVAWTNDSASDPRALVVSALAGAKRGPAMTLVPSHDGTLAMVLEEAGFGPEQTYETLVKVLAVPVMEPARAVAAVG